MKNKLKQIVFDYVPEDSKEILIPCGIFAAAFVAFLIWAACIYP